jgi:hypothetical protein
MEEQDIQVELANCVLCIKGEKKTESEDKDRLFSERYYGRFERRIPVEEVEEDKVQKRTRYVRVSSVIGGGGETNIEIVAASGRSALTSRCRS